MTVLERVRSVVNSDVELSDMKPASIEKMIAMAYYIGCEEATKRVSDMYTQHIREQRERASNCRYRHMADAIVGSENYLYSPDYGYPMTTMFGSDPADK